MQHVLMITAYHIFIRAIIQNRLGAKSVEILFVLFKSPNFYPSCCLLSDCRSRDDDALPKHCIQCLCNSSESGYRRIVSLVYSTRLRVARFAIYLLDMLAKLMGDPDIPIDKYFNFAYLEMIQQ